MSEANKSMTPGDIFSQLQWKKDFLKRPEGRIGLVAGIILILAIFSGTIKPAMDAVAEIAWDGLSALIALGCGAVLIALGWALWPVLWKFWQVICRNMHRGFIRMAPLAHVYAYREFRASLIESALAALKRLYGVYKKMETKKEDVEKRARRVTSQISELAQDGVTSGPDFDALNLQATDYSDHLEDLQKRLDALHAIIQRLDERIKSRKRKLQTLDVRIGIAEEKLEIAGSMDVAINELRRDVDSSDEMSDGMVALRFIDDEFDMAQGSFDALDSELEDLTREDRLNQLVANSEGLARLQRALGEEVTEKRRVSTGPTRIAVEASAHADGQEENPYRRSFGSESNLKV